jgi:hypothetical protein
MFYPAGFIAVIMTVIMNGSADHSHKQGPGC